MKLLRPILLSVSIILFAWLFISNINLINVATTLNEAEIDSEIKKVNEFTDMMRLKEFAIEKINYMETIRNRFADNAMIRVAVISVLIILQVLLYATGGNMFSTKATR
ncbi:hypothetical protein [Chryseobacterium shandongense]|jgi:hypothetical protein|uniref:hypothetical protein n=1 Tax=Chryseobacterium shandongense TaxID=1493872 RepID=UPI000F4D4356|nr:hypothetical protein [Chryseobacterium shandongense]AZA58391.1 hypothetical protein EG350_14870 [Chryseobacterium shandongense]